MILIIYLNKQKLKKISKKISEADKNYNQSINVMVNELLPNYENNCLKEYLKLEFNQDVDDKLIFGKGKEDRLIDEKTFMVKKLKNSFNLLIT